MRTSTPRLASDRFGSVQDSTLRPGRQGEPQRGGGPAAGGDGDELVLAVRETALEVELERLAPRGDEPGPVVLLRTHLEGHSAPVGRIVRGELTGLGEG